MRWQRLSVFQSIFQSTLSADRRRIYRSAPALDLAACLLAGAALILATVPCAHAEESDEVVEGGEVSMESESSDRGMPASNPRVKSILATHPGELVTICVAGCADKPAIVQMLPKPIEKRVSSMRTTAGGAAPGPARPAYDTADPDSVICVAGCDQRRGEVVQRLPGLPPQNAALPPRSEPAGNEPLDVR